MGVTCYMSRVTCHPYVPRSVCCGLETVRYITIQAEGSSAAIKVGKLLVKVALPRCDDSTVETPCSNLDLL